MLATEADYKKMVLNKLEMAKKLEATGGQCSPRLTSGPSFRGIFFT